MTELDLVMFLRRAMLALTEYDITHTDKFIKYKNKRCVGLCDHANRKITLSNHKDIETQERWCAVIHELVHAVYPHWSEAEVREYTNNILKILIYV